jgi:DNA polymerase-3 subunit gamma/tau
VSGSALGGPVQGAGGAGQAAGRQQDGGQTAHGGGAQVFQGAGGQAPNGGGLSKGGGLPNGGATHGGQPSNGARSHAGAKPQNGARPRTAIEQAREAASRAANAPRRGAGAPAAVAESVWEGAAADEPPFDPDYDRPVADPRFPGLDPGDELLDDANSVRESSEEAALRLLSEALGAEKIGETTS